MPWPRRRGRWPGATGSRLTPYTTLTLAAFRGHEAEAAALIETTAEEVVARGEGIGVTIARWASAVLYNGLGRYDEARVAAEEASRHPEDLRFATRALVELIEAASRSGHPDRAAAALEQLTKTTRVGGTNLGLGTEARARALVSEGEQAELAYREAIERLGRTRVTTALARAHLVYGEWLRRGRRRLDAREQLRVAYGLFVGWGWRRSRGGRSGSCGRRGRRRGGGRRRRVGG